MTSARRRMRLGLFILPTGHHIAAWRHPDSEVDAAFDFRRYAALAHTAERGKFDFLFLADSAAVRAGSIEALQRSAHDIAQFEPLTMLAALSAVTERIGLIATVTTSYNEPYHVARKFASLDHLSNGRAGWNVVTSGNFMEAPNFGLDAHYQHDLRYDRAHEFFDIVCGMWDSWDDDAFTRDREAGIYFDRDKLHVLNHKGKYFLVSGPLNVARPPQGRPVIVQAGSSDVGRDLAAEIADVAFSAQPTLAGAQAFCADLKKRMEKFGRQPDELKFMPGIMPIVGRTPAEAQDKFATLQSLIHPDAGLGVLRMMLGVDLSDRDLDGPLPDSLPPGGASTAVRDSLVALAQREGLSIRQLYLRVAPTRGHWLIAGTPAQIVDQMEERFVNFAADGFNVLPPLLPRDLDDFVNLVVPELQRRDLFRNEYEGSMLRENLGLPRPRSRYSA